MNLDLGVECVWIIKIVAVCLIRKREINLGRKKCLKWYVASGKIFKEQSQCINVNERNATEFFSAFYRKLQPCTEIWFLMCLVKCCMVLRILTV